MVAAVSGDLPSDVAVREATPSDLADLLNVLDGAALATDFDRVEACVRAGDALVAVADAATDAEPTGEDDADPNATVLGALVLAGERIEALGVRRRRRGQGIGTALVRAASARRERLVAEFDADARPFYESLEFAIEPAEESGRFRGHLE